jgi:hypothetical protein
VHFWAGLGIRRLVTADSTNPKIILRRKKNILGKICLIIDEMSMLHDTLLADIAKVVAHVKKIGNEGDPYLPFGGMHVILFGDFHQFPPVAKTSSALYSRQITYDADALQGRHLYDQFRSVFSLEQQIRVKDQTWIQILDRLRVGECNTRDLETIRGLILNTPRCPPTDFQRLPWSEAILITTRHTVRELWNSACLKRHCLRTGNVHYIVSSEDYIKGTMTTPTNDVRREIARTKERLTGKLSDRIEIAVGMKAMIKYNISTEGDVANGTRGTIEEIILDPREEPPKPDEVGVVRLKYPPAVILFKPDGASDISSAFEDNRGSKSIHIPKGLVPISPSIADFTIAMPDGSSLRISRCQYAITGGYAFTDFKSQGQSIDPVLVDIRNPPTGKLSPFSAYVALSRSKGRDSIRLLSDFNEELFQTHPNIDLAVEMDRLRALERKTRM